LGEDFQNSGSQARGKIQKKNLGHPYNRKKASLVGGFNPSEKY